MNSSFSGRFLDFVRRSPTSAFAVKNAAGMLEKAGFRPLPSGRRPEPGQYYYLIRGGGTLAAWRMQEDGLRGFMIAAPHSDSPCFRLRDHAELPGRFLRLDAEPYGGILPPTWWDRPLSIAGKVIVRTETGAGSRLIDFARDCALMPGMAPHLMHAALEGMKFDVSKDLVAVFSANGTPGTFTEQIAHLAGCAPDEILSSELFLYSREQGCVWGPEDEFLSAPRLDDLGSVFPCLEGFLTAQPGSHIPVLVLFDHEEIGSHTNRGAASDFLPRLLRRIAAAYGCDGEERFSAVLENSFLLSADSSHALHPNYPHFFDRAEYSLLGGGLSVKHSPTLATDALSSALFKEICRREGIPVQDYSHRPDLGGGRTLGPIADETVSIPTADVGLPQLSMHSAYETVGVRDLEALLSAARALFSARFAFEGGKIRWE